MEVNSLCKLAVFGIYIPFMCLLIPAVDHSFTFVTYCNEHFFFVWIKFEVM